MIGTKFAVVTSARTGSTWLIDRLDSQPNVSAYGELLLARSRTIPQLAGRSDFPRFIEVSSRAPKPVLGVFSYLNELYKKPGIVGFKIMYSCFRMFPEVLAYFAARRVRLIHLERHNLLDILISEEIARATGTSHVTRETSGQTPRITIDASTVVGRLTRLESTRKQARWLLRMSTCPLINVTYERLVDSDQEFGRIVAFLGIEQALEYRSQISKRATARHHDAILNFDEVRLALSASRFASMLD